VRKLKHIKIKNIFDSFLFNSIEINQLIIVENEMIVDDETMMKTMK